MRQGVSSLSSLLLCCWGTKAQSRRVKDISTTLGCARQRQRASSSYGPKTLEREIAGRIHPTLELGQGISQIWPLCYHVRSVAGARTCGVSPLTLAFLVLLASLVPSMRLFSSLACKNRRYPSARSAWSFALSASLFPKKYDKQEVSDNSYNGSKPRVPKNNTVPYLHKPPPATKRKPPSPVWRVPYFRER